MGTTSPPGASRNFREVSAVVEELGLVRSPLPERLAGITADDVHLGCWHAITPSAETIAGQLGLPFGDKL